jgi:hypothetical protein
VQDTTPAAELDRLAGMLRRLRPDWRDGEQFYELRSEVIGGIQQVAKRLGQPSSPPVAPRVTILGGYARRCLGCNQPFHAVRPEQRCCSSRCRVRLTRQRRRAAKAA